MRTFVSMLFCCSLFSAFSLSTSDTNPVLSPKNELRLSVGFSIIRSHFYSSSSEDLHPIGYEGKILYKINDRMRFKSALEVIPAIPLAPQWIGAKTSYYCAGLDFLSYFADNAALMYVSVDFFVQKWSGFFLGQNPQNVLHYQHREYTFNYFGVSGGLGTEFQIYRNISLYCEINIRFNMSKIELNDQLLVGTKINIPKLHKIFRKPNERYHWF